MDQGRIMLVNFHKKAITGGGWGDIKKEVACWDENNSKAAIGQSVL